MKSSGPRTQNVIDPPRFGKETREDGDKAQRREPLKTRGIVFGKM